jgi:HK97 family phage portal protein
MWTIAQQILWGIGVSEIKFGANGLELWPIEGDYISKIDQLDNGKIVFDVNEPGKAPRRLTQDQVFRAEGASTHRLIPEAILRRAREAVGAWLAQEQYRSFYFKNGASPSVVFTHPGPQPMSDKGLERLKAQLQARTGGVNNAHRALVMEEGVTARAFGTSAKDALMVEAWNTQVLEFARFLEMPAFLLDATATLPYNSRESAMLEWVGLSVRPRARLIEASMRRDLFVEDDAVCEHDLKGITSGDALNQQQADCGYVTTGVLSVNEVRVELGRSKRPEPEFDIPRRSANIGTDPGGDPSVTPRPGDKIAPSQPPPAPKKKNNKKRVAAIEQQKVAAIERNILEAATLEANSKNELITRLHRQSVAAASSLLRRETEQLRRRGAQLAGKPDEWRAWLTEFYIDHRAKMMQGLAIEFDHARVYAGVHLGEVVQDGIGVCERWEKGEAVRMMVEMAMMIGGGEEE